MIAIDVRAMLPKGCQNGIRPFKNQQLELTFDNTFY